MTNGAPREIGQRMKKARLALGWTQAVFAQRAGVSQGTIGRWERGNLPPVRELIRISNDVLKIDSRVLVVPGPELESDIAQELITKLDEALRRLSALEQAVANGASARGRRSARKGVSS